MPSGWGGEVRIKDPEARLDAAYCELMGVRFDLAWYSCSDTVTDVVEGVIGPLVVSGLWKGLLKRLRKGG